MHSGLVALGLGRFTASPARRSVLPSCASQILPFVHKAAYSFAAMVHVNYAVHADLYRRFMVDAMGDCLKK